jgi:hypothetical protein
LHRSRDVRDLLDTNSKVHLDTQNRSEIASYTLFLHDSTVSKAIKVQNTTVRSNEILLKAYGGATWLLFAP